MDASTATHTPATGVVYASPTPPALPGGIPQEPNEWEQELLEAELTPREKEALLLRGKGCSLQQMGENMGCSPKTAGAHLMHAASKLDMTIIEAVVVAAKAGWL